MKYPRSKIFRSLDILIKRLVKNETIENTSEEIFDAYEECYQRLVGNFDSDPEMVNLNEEFKKCYPTDTVTPKFKAPFGEKFMRQNIELFR